MIINIIIIISNGSFLLRHSHIVHLNVSGIDSDVVLNLACKVPIGDSGQAAKSQDLWVNLMKKFGFQTSAAGVCLQKPLSETVSKQPKTRVSEDYYKQVSCAGWL